MAFWLHAFTEKTSMGLVFALLLMGIPALVLAIELMNLNGTIYRPPKD